MELTVLGSGSAMPVPDRAQAGYLLDDGDRSLLVDCGSGVLGRLAGTDTGYEGVSTVLVTHLHLDHVAALFPLLKARWLAGEEHLEVVGPAGTKALVDGLLDVHDYLDGRIDLAVREVSAARDFSAAGFDVTARATRHSMDGLAYRVSPPSADAPAAAGTARALGRHGGVRGAGVVCGRCRRLGPRLLVPRRRRRLGAPDADEPRRVARGRRHRHPAALASLPDHGRSRARDGATGARGGLRRCGTDRGRRASGVALSRRVTATITRVRDRP